MCGCCAWTGEFLSGQALAHSGPGSLSLVEGTVEPTGVVSEGGELHAEFVFHETWRTGRGSGEDVRHAVRACASMIAVIGPVQ